MDRISTVTGTLARRGVLDPGAAAAALAAWPEAHSGPVEELERLLDAAADSADPDAAIAALSGLATSAPAVFAAVAADARLGRRFTRVVAASAALGHHLGVRPEDVAVLAGDLVPRPAAELRAELLGAIGADPDAESPVADPAGVDVLRLTYRRELLRIAGRDLDAPDPTDVLPGVAAELADLADATVEAALALARGGVDGWERVRLAVLAMGKCGARELNYVSDVDVVYVVEPSETPDGEPACSPEEAVAIGTRLAGALARNCSAHTRTGTIWQVDANLRPEGKAGPLVRTLASMRAYYDKWARNWEFQALLKARPMAGDRALGEAFVGLVAPHVWRVADDPQFVGETQAMRRRVISLIAAKERDREIKLGAGGLRDTEFTVQLLQLVHGRADERLRLRGTLEALDALIACGYVGRTDGADLADAYRFQRVLEHRAQLRQLRRTHLLPADGPERRRVARSMGLGADELTERWQASTRRVLRLHQRLFYSPLLEAVARIPTDEVRLTSEAARTRLAALGFNDPAAALRHIGALSQGISRKAEIQRQLLPAMLMWFAEGPQPDHGLLAFRQVSEALGDSAWYLRALRDEGAMAENLARVLSSSRFAVDLLQRAPQTVELLKRHGCSVPTAGEVLERMEAVARRHDDPVAAVQAIRGVRREEILGLVMSDVLGSCDTAAIGRGLSEVMDATLAATLRVVLRGQDDPPRLAFVALGRWGGRELAFSSDADAMVVLANSDDPDATARAIRIVGRVRELLGRPGPDAAVEVDLDLRPEGKGGPVVRTLTSYRAYYERWASTWEAHALIRAAHGAGDRELSAEFLDMIDPVRYVEGGIDERQVREIKRLKARMENERMPRGVDPRRHVKLGPGGLTDVEWTVQLLQLRHAYELPALRTTQTLAALDAEEQAGLLSAEDAEDLRAAWTLATRIRNAAMLLRGRPSDTLPTDARERAAVAEMLGYAKGEASVFVDDHARTARRARAVMDRIFWGTGS